MPLLSWYDTYNEDYFWNIVENGVDIYTSGTSGEPKKIYNPATKIKADADNACKIQEISSDSKVYTCLNPTRAGGLFAQTIPALIAGADVDLEEFSPYRYVSVVDQYTHSHLTPKQAKAVMKTKTFNTLELTGHVFLIGSEPITWDIVEAFIGRGARVIFIWGMSEIGVNAILHIFDTLEQVEYYKQHAPADSLLLGNIINCEYKIIDGVLWVRGDICVFDGWFNTHDLVVRKDDCLYYVGRDNANIDFDNPQKG